MGEGENDDGIAPGMSNGSVRALQRQSWGVVTWRRDISWERDCNNSNGANTQYLPCYDMSLHYIRPLILKKKSAFHNYS